MAVDGKSKKSLSKMYPLILLAAIGIILLLLGADNEDVRKNELSYEGYMSEYDEEAYEKKLTLKIEELCSSVRGAGKVKVALTFDGSYKAIYAQDTDKKEYILLGSGSNEKALLIGYEPPKILGVGIVCEGAVDRGVRAEIVSLISAFLDLPTNKIYVATLKN